MYIFGIDLPIMEILFLFLLLFSAGLIIIWFDLRKLRKLITKEEIDVNELEEDLDEVEDCFGKKLLCNREKEAKIERLVNDFFSKKKLKSVSVKDAKSSKAYKLLLKLLVKSVHQGYRKNLLCKILIRRGWPKDLVEKEKHDLEKIID
jgi:hypothetical protein